jgi:hypothetical protein
LRFGIRHAEARSLTEDAMTDLVFVASTIAFFAIALACVAGCDRL